MKNKKLIYLLAAILIGSGIFFSVIGFIFGGRPGISIGRGGLSSTHYTTKNSTPYTLEKTKLDSFTDINISMDYADINIIESDGYYLEYHLSGSSPKPYYEVSNKKFTFKERPKAVNFLQWDFSFFTYNETDNFYINLYVPHDQHYNTVKLYNDYGDIALDFINADTLKITSDYGDIDIDELTGGSATLSLDAGDLDVKKAKLDSLDINNDYGNVSFEEISSKNAKLTLSSGDIDLEKAVFTKLKIRNDYGSVTIDLTDKFKDYTLDLGTDYGSIELNDVATYTDEDRETYKAKGDSSRILDIYCDSGDISLNEK